MKTKSIYVLIIVVLLVILAIYIAKVLVVNPDNPNPEEKEEEQRNSNEDTFTTVAEFPLKLTSPMKRGTNVRQLQNWLNKKAKKTGIFATITVDGIFGQKTETLLYNITGKKEMSQLEFTTQGVYLESKL